jgi:hypothetical protein
MLDASAAALHRFAKSAPLYIALAFGFASYAQGAVIAAKWRERGVLWSTGSSTSIAACLHAQQSVSCEHRTAGHHNLPTKDQALLMLETITWPLQSNELPPTWPSVATQRTARAETAAGAHSATPRKQQTPRAIDDAFCVVFTTHFV